MKYRGISLISPTPSLIKYNNNFYIKNTKCISLRSRSRDETPMTKRQHPKPQYKKNALPNSKIYWHSIHRHFVRGIVTGYPRSPMRWGSCCLEKWPKLQFLARFLLHVYTLFRQGLARHRLNQPLSN